MHYFLLLALVSFISCQAMDYWSFLSYAGNRPYYYNFKPDYFYHTKRKIDELIKLKMDLNEKCYFGRYEVDTPLNIAVAAKYDQLNHYVKLLLTNGANPNIGNPLKRAFENDSISNAQLLIEYGADIDKFTGDNAEPTVLFSVLAKKNFEQVKFLVSNKANLNKGNNHKNTLMHILLNDIVSTLNRFPYIETKINFSVAAHLVIYGTDYYTKKNENNETAFDIVKKHGWTDLLGAMNVHPFSLKQLCINAIRDHKDKEKDGKKMFADLSCLPEELQSEFFWTKQKKIVAGKQ